MIMLRRYSRKSIRRAREAEQRRFGRFWLTIGSSMALALVLFLSVSGAAAYVAYRFYYDAQTKYVPRVTSLHDLLPLDNLKMYDSKGILISQLTDQGLHTSVALNQVSPFLINATVDVEDKNFWSNEGVDLQRILRAALDDVTRGHVVEGGSTITQQLIKNLVVGNDPTIERKLDEIVLTPQVNKLYTKNDILQMYLNTIYYGEQAYGIDAAATVYFNLQDQPGKPAAMQLDLAQAAMLAGLPSSPYSFDPHQHPQAAFQRFMTVITAMYSQGHIKKSDMLAAIAEVQGPHFFKAATNLGDRAPHFSNFVELQLEKSFHLTRAQLSRSDMSVYTTLDIQLQDKIQKIMQEHIAELRDTHNVSNAAEVLIDYHTGAIISLLGSIDYNDKSIDGQFDVASQAYRQPGSSFKPYVYVTAFEQGTSPAQAINDSALTIYLPNSIPHDFTPKNYDLKYHGHMTLRCALQNSLNIPAVKVLQHVGIDPAMKTAYDMGVTSYEGTPGYSLVLGGLGVRLLDHTSAYGTFANGGVHVPYYSLQKVVFATSQQTYGHPQDAGTRVLSPQLAYMMTSVLSDNASRIPEFYDCNPLQLYSNSEASCWAGNRGLVRPAAAKTGTTTDFRDNWTMGYTTDYVMGVWAGNDDNSKMIDVTGVHGAAPIWHDAMLLAEQGHPVRDFTNPGGLQKASVTYPDGVTTSDWFLPGKVPTFHPTPTLAPSSTAISTHVPQASDDFQTAMLSAEQADLSLAPAASVQPYCPSSYSFAFDPPASNTVSPNQGWW